MPLPDRNRELFKYAGLATQIFVLLGIAVFLGRKADRWINISFPFLVWFLPLLAIVAVIYQIIKDTSGKKHG